MIQTWGIPRRGPGARGARGAFTLVEMMVVIAILVILLGLVAGVGHYVWEDAARKETLATQSILMSAIKGFYEVRDVYPGAEVPWPPDADPNGYDSGKQLLKYLKGDLPAGLTADQKKDILSATLKYLTILPKEALKDTDDAVRDGYGTPMRYVPRGGLGGGPILVSAGPDHKFGGTAGDNDNIRSDGRGQ